MALTNLVVILLLFFLPHPIEGEDDQASDLQAFCPKASTIDPNLVLDEYRVYNRSELYDYINGGAEVYLDLGFFKVGACDYKIQWEEETYFTLDVYDMGTPENAFGIFSAERYEKAPAIQVGVEGYMGGGALNFWARQYYVKIRADDEGEKVDRLLKQMAGQVASRIGEPGALPADLGLFPQKDRIRSSERYAARNLLGFSALKGFSCRYQHKEAEVTLYLCHYAKEKEAVLAEKQFVARLKPAPSPDEDGRGLRFKDRYLGQGRVFRVGSYLTLVQGLPDKETHAAWADRLVLDFYNTVTEAAAREKTDRALEALERDPDQGL
jgi:hypothetical protein